MVRFKKRLDVISSLIPKGINGYSLDEDNVPVDPDRDHIFMIVNYFYNHATHSGSVLDPIE
jgi:hypothetical protein